MVPDLTAFLEASVSCQGWTCPRYFCSESWLVPRAACGVPLISVLSSCVDGIHIVLRPVTPNRWTILFDLDSGNPVEAVWLTTQRSLESVLHVDRLPSNRAGS